MIHLLFVRHGEDEDNAQRVLNGRRDQPLTVQGRMQAARTARRLSILRPDVVYVSPLLRTRETAGIICRSLGLRPPVIDGGLIERDFGTMTGVAYDDIGEKATRTISAHGFTVFLDAPRSESHADVMTRTLRAVAAIKDRHENQRVLLVSHGDVFKSLLMGLEQKTLEQAIRDRWLENAEIADFGLR